MSQIQTTEKFIQTIFGTFVSILVSTILSGAYSSIIFTPVVFTAIVLALIAMGYTTWYMSELHMMKVASEVIEPEKREASNSGILAEATLALSVGLGAFIYRDQTLMWAITSNWHFAGSLVAGILLFYVSAIGLLYIASNQVGSDNQLKKQAVITDMSQYLNNFLQELLLSVPFIFLGSFFINTAVISLMTSHIWVFTTITSLAGAALAHVHMSEMTLNQRVRESHKGSFLYRLNIESRKLLVRLAVGIVLTLLAGVLLLNAGFIAAHQSVVLAVIALIVVASEFYLIAAKFSALNKKTFDDEAPHPEVSSKVGRGLGLNAIAEYLIPSYYVMQNNDSARDSNDESLRSGPTLTPTSPGGTSHEAKDG